MNVFIKKLYHKPQIVVYGIMALILISGLIYSFYLGDQLRYSDEHEYLNIAKNLLSIGKYSLDGVKPTAYRAPGLPFLIYFGLFLGTNIEIIRFFNFMALAGSCLFLYLISKRLNYPIAGGIAALLVIFYPVLFYTAGTLFPQTIGSFLLLASLFFWFNFKEQNISHSSIIAGLLFGLLVLTIPAFLMYWIVMAIMPLFLSLKYKWKRMLLFTLSSLMVVGLWTARNYIVFNSFIPVSTNSGINLLLGNSKNTKANSGVNVDISEYKPLNRNINEVELDKYYRSMAFKWIFTHKLEAAKLYFKKVANYFNYKNNLATRKEASSFKNIVMLLTYGTLLTLFIVRIALFKIYNFEKIEYYIIGFYFLSAFFSALFFTRIRFRLPFDVLLILINSIFIIKLLTRHKI